VPPVLVVLVVDVVVVVVVVPPLPPLPAPALLLPSPRRLPQQASRQAENPGPYAELHEPTSLRLSGEPRVCPEMHAVERRG